MTDPTEAEAVAAEPAATSAPSVDSFSVSAPSDETNNKKNQSLDTAAKKQSLGAGNKIYALDVRGQWCEAIVRERRGSGPTTEILIHYQGWKKKCVVTDAPPRVRDPTHP
jgi:hypothetical protein